MINSEEQPDYKVSHNAALPPVTPPPYENRVIEQALDILEKRLARPKQLTIGSPDDADKYLILKLAQKEHEVFAIMFLDNRHQLISYQEMFRGTIDGASVYPREVVKESLKQNAAALIVAHNHPSGIPEPSNADEQITIRLKKALALVDIRLLDHIIIGGTDTVSLAERGIL